MKSLKPIIAALLIIITIFKVSSCGMSSSHPGWSRVQSHDLNINEMPNFVKEWVDHIRETDALTQRDIHVLILSKDDIELIDDILRISELLETTEQEVQENNRNFTIYDQLVAIFYFNLEDDVYINQRVIATADGYLGVGINTGSEPYLNNHPVDLSRLYGVTSLNNRLNLRDLQVSINGYYVRLLITDRS